MSAEGDLRRAVLAWLMLGCLVASWALWTRPTPSFQDSPEVLRVRKVEIIDGAGNIRLRIGVAADGAPSLRLYDGAGTRRLEVAVPAEGPGVSVFDAQGKERLMLLAPPGLGEAEVLQEDANGGP